MAAQSYVGTVEGIQKLKVDGAPGAVVYFTNIEGRAEKEKYEWQSCLSNVTEQGVVSMGDVLSNIETVIRENVQPKEARFLVAFPHIATLFGWEGGDGYRESNLYKIISFDPKTREPIKVKEGEVGCLLELLISAQEAELWAESKDVKEYYNKPREGTFIQHTIKEGW